MSESSPMDPACGLGVTYLEANIFHALPTIVSSGLTKNWLLLTSAADLSYLLKALEVFHTDKASAGLSHEVYRAGSLNPSGAGRGQQYHLQKMVTAGKTK